MARGGFRIGSGRPPGQKNKKGTTKSNDGKFKIEDINLDDPDAKVFLENLLMAPESEVDRKTKIQICNILLPFQHPRKGEGQGKKADLADRAQKAGSGRFSPSKPPTLERIK